MTTIAMAAGMLPSALGMGDGGGFRSPMAIAVIGGLVVSTLLSLVFVPAVFTVLDDLGRVLWRLFVWLLAPREKRVSAARRRARIATAPRTRRRCRRSRLATVNASATPAKSSCRSALRDLRYVA